MKTLHESILAGRKSSIQNSIGGLKLISHPYKDFDELLSELYKYFEKDLACKVIQTNKEFIRPFANNNNTIKLSTRGAHFVFRGYNLICALFGKDVVGFQITHILEGDHDTMTPIGLTVDTPYKLSDNLSEYLIDIYKKYPQQYKSLMEKFHLI